jgi:very-short-patch-repair endonuclease
VKGIHTHYERTHGSLSQQQKYSSGYNGKYNDESFRQKLRSPRHIITNVCVCCGKSFSYEKITTHPTKRTCSKSCAVSIHNTIRTANGYVSPCKSDEYRKRASAKSKELWRDPEYAKKVMSTSRRFTSKNEVIIRNYFMEKYPDDQWTFGAGLIVEGETIVRDLYSKKLKICFEYDGVWHFKDIHGQLAKKQLKDSLLEKWCIENNYSLIRIDEDKFNKSSLSMLDNIFYSLTESKIIKIGDRY